MKKVLIVRSSPKPARVVKEAISLTNAGYSVNILFWDRNTNKSRVEMNNDISINYFGLKAPYGTLKLIPYLFIWWVYEFIFLLKSDADIIHVCCFDTLIPAIFTKTLRQKKIVYDIFDFYAESLSNHIPKQLLNFIATLEKFCIQFADVLIIVDKSRKAQISGAKVKKLEVIMNCPTVVSEYKLESKNIKFTIFYGGMISKTRGLNQLIDAIRNEKDINLVVAGSGEDENIFTPIFNNVANIRFMGWINYDEYIKQTLRADVIFGLYDPRIPNNRRASPNKLFEAMMCGKPVIVNKETSMADIVRRENCGIIVPYSDELALKKAILELKNNPEMCKKMGEKGRAAFKREYNWEIMEERLLKLYANLIDNRLICERDFDENG
jgi:glycosyltransferase involved in cell wall biosynthesis